MRLANQYQKQFVWRAWSTVFDALPSLHGQTVLDLGCAVGDQAAELVSRGARVIGVDVNQELLEVARARGLAGAEFLQGDIRKLPDLGAAVDGIWCSFTPAYFPDFEPVLVSWTKHLRSGGFIVLTEVDDLFGHEPLRAQTKALLDGYARESLALQRYDFHSGRKLGGYLERAGFEVSKLLTLPDVELSFDGPADPEVLDAWQSRFDRMQALADFCGSSFPEVRAEFLATLARSDHRSTAQVICCVARRR